MRLLLLCCFCLVPVSAIGISDILARVWPSRFGAPKEPGSLEGDVAVLTDENWDEAKALSQNGDWLVEFYAPWCGHCKALAPIYAEAASKIKTLRFAKIDATAYADLRKSVGVTGFPTVLWMRKGPATILHSKVEITLLARSNSCLLVSSVSMSPSRNSDSTCHNTGNLNRYTGPRTLEGFEKLATRLAEPPVSFMETKQQLTDALAKDDLVKYVLSASKDDESTLAKIYATVASRSHDLMTFLHSTPEVIAESLELPETVGSPAVLRTEPGGDTIAFPSEEADTSTDTDLYDWVHSNKYTSVITLTRSNYYMVTTGSRLTVVAICAADERDAFAAEFRRIKRGQNPAITKEDTEPFQFATMDASLERLDRFLVQFGLQMADLPRVMALENTNRRYWYSGTSTPEGISAFLKGVNDGSVETNFMGQFAFLDKSWQTLKSFLPFLSALDFMPRFTIIISIALLMITGSLYVLANTDCFCCANDDDDVHRGVSRPPNAPSVPPRADKNKEE